MQPFIDLTCPNCKSPIRFGAEYFGEMSICPKCKIPVFVPNPAETPLIPPSIPKKTKKNNTSYAPIRITDSVPGKLTIVVKQFSPESNPVGTAGFVCAIVGIVCFWLPPLALALWILGLFLCVIGIFRKPREAAGCGLVLCLFPMLFTLGILIFGSATAMLNTASKSENYNQPEYQTSSPECKIQEDCTTVDEEEPSGDPFLEAAQEQPPLEPVKQKKPRKLKRSDFVRISQYKWTWPEYVVLRSERTGVPIVFDGSNEVVGTIDVPRGARLRVQHVDSTGLIDVYDLGSGQTFSIDAFDTTFVQDYFRKNKRE